MQLWGVWDKRKQRFRAEKRQKRGGFVLEIVALASRLDAELWINDLGSGASSHQAKPLTEENIKTDERIVARMKAD